MHTGRNVEPLPIKVRQFESGPGADTPRYWFNNDPFMTHFYNAISSMFPEGERFFIRSVGNFKNDITTPELAGQVSSFIQQEARHFKEHDAHSAILEAQGFGVLAKFNAFAKRGLEWTSMRMPRLALASTVATEHVTAVLADQILRRDDLWLTPMVPEMCRLWRWHAIEESEHKAVAFDVYQECIEQGQKGGLWLRRFAMAEVLLAFFFETFVRHCLMLAKDGELTPSSVWRGSRLLWGRDGLLRGFHPHIWQFFRRDFHPWQLDNTTLVKSSIEQLKSEGFATA